MSVTAMTLEVACEDSSHKVVPCMPDMCLVPGSPPVPAPFPVFGDTSKINKPKSHVLIEGGKTMTTDSEVSIKGNEGGTLKDVVTHTTCGNAFAMLGVPNVTFDGAPVVVTGCPGFANTM